MPETEGACTNVCTGDAEVEHGPGPEGNTEATDTIFDSQPVEGRFPEALAMLARLPLTDADRADAVRRLLA